MTPEEKFQLYFPGNEIPDRAFQEIKLFDETKYEISPEKAVKRPVPLPRIFGTNHPSYGDKDHRWIDMLVQLQRVDNSDFRPHKIEEILNPDLLKNIKLVCIREVNEYYIYWGGNHRITFNMLSEKDFIEVDVKYATLKPVKLLDLPVPQPRKELTLFEKTGNWIKSVFQ